MNRRTFLKSMGATALAAATSGAAAAAPRRPNVLLILTDDQGYGDIHLHGNAVLDTPVLDRLAADGARFDRFFVSPLCAPTRASLLTGRYHPRCGVSGVTKGYEVMRSEERTLAEVLRDAGYATGCFGKWHNGAYYPFTANGQGFEEFFGFNGGGWNNYFDTTLYRNGEPVKTAGFITDVLTDAALAFIENHCGGPFFCYVPYNAPHAPHQVSDRFFDKYKRRGCDAELASLYGMIENVDENVGRLLKKLDDLKIADQTIVLFLGDNGPNSKRFNGNMRGAKGSVDEGGIRVPMFFRWPGQVKPGSAIPQIAAHIDLLPTLCDLCGIADPKTRPLDGASLVPLLRGRAEGWPERLLFTVAGTGVQSNPRGSVRSPRWRAVLGGKKPELFDMQADPSQQIDLAAKHPDVVKQLRSAFDAWYKDVTRDGLEPPPIPVGYEQARTVELLAPDAKAAGGAHFKGGQGFANDWLTGWESADARASWNLDVVQDGRYEVTLMYTCPEADVGSTVAVETGGERVEGAVRRAHDPPPLPSPDRVPRKEVYEKVWAPLVLGTLTLKKGRTPLTVRALTKPGKTVFDLKAVRLVRQA